MGVQDALDRRFADGLAWGRWAVRLWDAFPVDADPRPVVLAGPREFIEGSYTTAEAKHAHVSGVPLTVHSRTRTTATFRTDRGPRELPAWRIEAAEIAGTVYSLDVPTWDPPERRPAPPAPRPPIGDPHGHAGLADDGRTLTVDVLGALPEYERYERAEVVSTPQAVAVVAHAVDLEPPGTIRLAAGYVHRVRVTLAESLGARVLVNLHGHAMEVTPVPT